MPGSSSSKKRKSARSVRPEVAHGFENRYGLLFEEAPVAMHEIDLDGIIRRVNRAECRLLGREAHELLGRHVSELVAPEERELSRESVRQKLSGEQVITPFRREYSGRDGSRLVLEIQENYLRDGNGAILGIRSALLDVTAQQRAREQLQQAHEELELRVRQRTAELARANEELRGEIAERRRAELRLALQYAVARVLTECESFDAAVPRLLDALCQGLGWEVGVLWTVQPAMGLLRFHSIRPEEPGAEITARLAAAAYAVGQNLPGEVWARRQPSWSPPAGDALGWPAGSCPWRSGIVFPVVHSSYVFAVIAIFSRRDEPADADLLETAAMLGAQIGQFIERTAAEQALYVSEGRFTAFMDNLPGIAFMKDAAGRYVYFSRAIEPVLGRPVASMIGKSDADVWPQEVAAGLYAYCRQVIQDGAPMEALQQIPQENGTHSWLFYLFPIPDVKGERTSLGGVAVDITERKLLEDQLRQSQKMDAIGRLAGGVAHDFNNLLTIIGGYGRMILDQLGPEDRARGSLELILNAADRAAVLTSQLLAFSRRQVVQPKLIELNHVVSNLEKMLRRVIGEHIALATVLDPALERVKADAGQIEQILMNLAINARDAMPNGGRLTIETANIEFRKSGQIAPAPHVRLSVIDTGIGMDEQTRTRLFEPFFTTKGRGKGTGLGLSTVYGIVKQHGGEIVVDSEPQAGARFHIYFPAAREQAPAAAPEIPAPEACRGTETVLLVEDEAGVRHLARDILRSAGYRVLEAADGQAALRVAESEQCPIHLLLTDMIMPLMSGRELADRMRQRGPIKVIFMSGYTDDVIAYHGELGPGSEFVQKPFATDALLRKVREVLDHGKPGKANAGRVR